PSWPVERVRLQDDYGPTQSFAAPHSFVSYCERSRPRKRAGATAGFDPQRTLGRRPLAPQAAAPPCHRARRRTGVANHHECQTTMAFFYAVFMRARTDSHRIFMCPPSFGSSTEWFLLRGAVSQCRALGFSVPAVT